MSEENQQSVSIDLLTVGELITMSEAAQLTGFNSSFLGRLAAKGKLKAKKSGGIWLTTLAAVENYKENRNFNNIPKKYRDRS